MAAIEYQASHEGSEQLQLRPRETVAARLPVLEWLPGQVLEGILELGHVQVLELVVSKCCR